MKSVAEIHTRRIVDKTALVLKQVDVQFLARGGT